MEQSNYILLDLVIIKSGADLEGGAPGARPPVRPYMQDQKINLRPPVQSDIFYCLRPPVQHFLDPRL